VSALWKEVAYISQFATQEKVCATYSAIAVAETAIYVANNSKEVAWTSE